MGKCNSWRRITERTKAAMEEDRIISELNRLLGVSLRRQMGIFVGLPGYHIEVVNSGNRAKVEETWQLACERADPIETPVVLYHVPGKEYGECRVLMATSEFARSARLPVELDYTMDMSIKAFAVLWQQAQARQMQALMGTKRFVIEYDLQVQ